MSERVLLGEVGEGPGGDQQTEGWDLDSYPKPFLLLDGDRWAGRGCRRTPPPSSISWDISFPVPCPLHLNFLHINHLCHFEISQSSYYSSIVNDTIDQGINYASWDKKGREQNTACSVQATHKAAKGILQNSRSAPSFVFSTLAVLAGP